MAQEIINIGNSPNDGLGDPIRTAYIKCNNNFGELYSRVQAQPPSTLVGSVGDQAGMYAYDSSYFYYCFADYDGSSIIWAQVSQIGNVSVSQIVSGTSNVKVADIDGNVAISIDSTSNVAVFTVTGLTTGNVNATNVNATNLNGTIVSGILATAAQNNITSVGTLTSLAVTANTSTGNLTTSGLITATGNITGGNIKTSGVISTSGNVVANNISVSNVISTTSEISATGNITTTGGYFVGNFFGNITGNFVVPGSTNQIIFNTSGNADAVSDFTFNKNTKVLSVVGDSYSTNFIATANITASGNVSGGNIITTGALNSSSVSVTNAASAGGNVTGANLRTTGTVTATGNVIGGNILTSGLISVSGTATVGNVLTAGVLSASGNVTGGNVIGGAVSAVTNVVGANLLSSGNVSASGNVLAGNVVTSGVLINSQVSTTGNVTGSYLFGNAYFVSGLSPTRIYNGTSEVSIGTSNGNANISINGTSNVLVVLTSGITVTGVSSATANVVGGNLVTGGLVSATGTVSGSSVLGSVVSASANITGGNVLTGGLISASGNMIAGSFVTSGLISTPSITKTGSNAVGNIGSSSNYFNTIFSESFKGTSTSALYADLAERYLSDTDYEPGTVLSFGGELEVTQSVVDSDNTIAGVVSTQPAYQMNCGLEGEHVVALALTGRVPCKVQGTVTKGAMMVSAGNGRARAEAHPQIGTVIGKALESFSGDQGIIEIVVGRV